MRISDWSSDVCSSDLETDAMLFKECYRILKPNGILRIVVPDVSLFCKNYATNNREWFKRWEQLLFIQSPSPERAKRRLTTPMEAISFVTQEYGHISAWDFETLKAYLEKAGFSKIQHVAFRQGENSDLFIELDDAERKFVSIYVEAKK